MESRNQNSEEYSRLLHDQQERLKELSCINETTSILRQGKSMEESLWQIVHILPRAWQYPDYTIARIIFRGKTYESENFNESPWRMVQDFSTIDGQTGIIEIYYTIQFKDEDEGPFFKEERDLIINIANIISGYINSSKARELFFAGDKPVEDKDAGLIPGKKLFQEFLDLHNQERDLFHDLMPFRVKEILLVANLYDAYTIEGEGRFSDLLLGEYYKLSLSTVPRLTGVSDEQEAMDKLRKKNYDMVIIMAGIEKDIPVDICKKIKTSYPYLPVYLLLNDPADVPMIRRKRDEGMPVDKYYLWTGESKIFFTMVNLLEDKVNAENDTKKGLIRVILLVEDSSRFYSRLLPMLYQLVMEQTKDLIEDVSADDLFKVLRLKARPKILHATNYEDAMMIINKYKDCLLCLISDMRFPKNNLMHDQAGFELVKYVKQELPNLPVVLQSSDPGNSKFAHSLKVSFINKNSESLLQDFKSFITYYLGFGSFNFMDRKGDKIAVASSMKEFEKYLQSIPEDSLLYHANKNHFSLWLMARGEVKIAKMIGPLAVKDFGSLKEMREFLVDLVRQRRRELNRGKVVNFEESAAIDETNIISLAGGSLGGKGRGLAFVNTLIYSFDIGRLLNGINIKTPVTAIIGTDEFDLFMERNHLRELVKEEKDYRLLQEHFISSELSFSLEKRLKSLLIQMDKPLAVRSSSLFEDSIKHPFSGIFGTYLLPNNHSDPNVRFKQLCQAIKLVFCSVYSPDSRTWFEAIGYSIEQEKMAVVIQTVVGNKYENLFYPHISGTAQSYNFYPVSHMTPEDGFAVIAVGLGQYVVQGEKSFRFSPAYPSIDVISQKDQYINSQVKFYAVELSNREPDLLQGENAGLAELEISVSERHGTLKHCASVLDQDNDVIVSGLDRKGPRVVNFADILKYEFIPLASSLKTVLGIVKDALGTPSEIEFAVDLNKDESGNASFYLLQIKPLAGNGSGYTIDRNTIMASDLVLFSGKSMGNGIIEDITDIIYFEPRNLDSKISLGLAEEISRMNDKMLKDKKSYILIGPGRWGSRDPSLGIPVVWPQISRAKIIVEVNIPGLFLDASMGSHFFHNVTSMNVGYFSVNLGIDENAIHWEKLHTARVLEEGTYFRHVRFDKGLIVRMDGRKGIAAVSINTNNKI